MAYYKKLLVGSGGGIVSTAQQADQVSETATLIIGLGGTGVHCIRTIKTQVYDRLKPDDPNSAIPEYSHIRFLGVDTTDNSQGGALVQDPNKDDYSAFRALDNSEFFNIGKSSLASVMDQKIALGYRKEVEWLEHEDIGPNKLSDAGAGGKRQLGRFMLMDKSEEFMGIIAREIELAKTKLSKPTVNVHIFSGLSGGTGSGCFLDVCYMVKELVKKDNGRVYGYFFLPDVNLKNIPHNDRGTRKYIELNGYAALQELDYCMRIGTNGGSFKQLYGGHKEIEWKEAPVTLCHLISATNSNGAEFPEAYDYAMNVAAEYVMDILTASDNEMNLEALHSNFDSKVDQTEGSMNMGAEVEYLVIGAASSSLPLKEVNTYLASALFEKLSHVSDARATKLEVDKFAIDAISPSATKLEKVYDGLYKELTNNDLTFERCKADKTYVRSSGCSSVNKFYEERMAAKVGTVQTVKKQLLDSAKQSSLIGRVHTNLKEIIKDAAKGPFYAQSILAGGEDTYTLIDIVDGWIAHNTERLNRDAKFKNTSEHDVRAAKESFEATKGLLKSAFGKEAKSLEKLKDATEDYYKLEFDHYARKELGDILVEFRKQLLELNASYYLKFMRITDNLFSTFEENRQILNSAQNVHKNRAFDRPMLTIDDIRDTLNEKVGEQNIENCMNRLMEALLSPAGEIAWKTDDENKIAHIVTEFFTKEIFADYAQRTIIDFLKDKYKAQYKESPSNEQLADYVERNYVSRLTQDAKPLFPVNDALWHRKATQDGEIAFMTIPAAAGAIELAAERIAKGQNQWKIKKSQLNDRIFAMCCSCALPLCAYGNLAEYEHEYFSEKEDAPGRHYYEGKKIEGMKFTDWRKLPAITPVSRLDPKNNTNLPERLRDLSKDAEEVYEKAIKLDIIRTTEDDPANYIKGATYVYGPSEESKQRLVSAIKAVKEYIPKVMTVKELEEAKSKLANLVEAKELDFVRTDMKLECKGTDFADIIRKDLFVSAPMYVFNTKEIIKVVTELTSEATALIDKMNNVIEEVSDKGRYLNDYMKALFYGILNYKGNKMSYSYDEYGIERTAKLCEAGMEFVDIPIYQGFVSFCRMDAAVRSMILSDVEKFANADAPDYATPAKALQKETPPRMVNGWQQNATTFEQANEILEFIKTFQIKFNAHCTMYEL